MNNKTLAFVCFAAVLLSGCIVTSVHPFYTNKDLTYEPSIVGQWTNTQSDERWVFTKGAKDSYELVYVSSGKTNVTQAHLFKLRDKLFLDMGGIELETEIMPPPVPSHLLLRVEQLTPIMRLAPLNHDWLKTLLEKEPKTIEHLMLGDKADDRRVVLTANTPTLQAFLVKHLANEEVWKDTFELKREPPR